ncbi:MAG: MFS transporter [Desulfatibacillum sp.]|nr:MFS transporter [Desulfatibacillum sp.]
MEPADTKKMYVFLMVLTIASALGLQSWMTLFNNFAVEKVGLDGQHVGVIQSVREIPGFLSLLAIYVMLIMKEHRLSALSILLLGAGVASTGLFPSFAGLLCATLVMSFGFHYFETTNQSLTLQYFDQTTSPKVFGRLRSLASGANIVVGASIYGLSYILDYRGIYLVFGGVVIATGAWGMTRNPVSKNLIPQRKKMILKKAYWLYYFLTFMAGARRQIFIAFAVFLMVQRFGYTIKEITILFLINNLVNYFLAPIIGKSILRFGERKVLSLEYASLILVFVAYATVQNKTAIGVIYILDHIFFNFAIAIRTYFQKIGDPRDIAPTMAVGFTINHIAAVVLPALGGLLWMVDYRIPFYAGAVMSLVSLMAVQAIRTGQNP